MSESMQSIFTIVGYVIYGAQAWTALFALFVVVLLFRRIAQKRFRSFTRMQDFLQQVRDLLQQRRFDEVAALCDTPAVWAKVVPQLILVALANRGMEMAKLRRLLAETFERDVLADFDYRMAWINTIVKSAPMLGLLGTVQGMIGAFGKIALAAREGGIDPSALAGDISFALWTTAIGLMIAIPLVVIAAMIQVRIGKLQDQVQQGLGQFLEDFDAARAPQAA
jgi:biopolymer transport protein ExbB/TolQ